MQQSLTNIVNDPQTILFHIRKNKKDVFFWIFGTLFTFAIYFCISSKDYSFLLVLSSMTQLLSFMVIFLKVYSLQSSAGLSLNTLICYLILLASRLSSTMFYYEYLPADTAGDWFYQLTEVLSLIICIALIVMVKKTYKETSDVTDDAVNYYTLAFPCLGLAMLVHTSLNRNFLTDVMWTFSMYLEGVAMFPQIFLFTKKSQIESYTSHYVSLQGLSRFFSLLFWWDTYSELNESIDDSFSLFHSYCGYFIILSQVVQLLIMLDFYYVYFKSLLKGEAMTIQNII